MVKYVLDTDHVIFYFNSYPRVVRAILSKPSNQIAITRFTHAELLYGALRSRRIADNLAKIRVLVQEIAVLEFTEKAALAYAQAKVELDSKGKSCPNLDLLIGSIALANKSILVTNNIKHFQHIRDLHLQNWT